MDIVEKMPDKWIKELTSCVSEKGLLFLDWYDAENLRDFIKAKDEEIERLREALAFYAEWGIDAPAVDAIIEEDCGDKARAALNIVLGEEE